MESMTTIATHLQALIKRTVHEEKDRAYMKSKKFNKTLLEVKPDYFSDIRFGKGWLHFGIRKNMPSNLK